MTLQITITRGEPRPNGNNARLSESANATASWHAADADYRVALPPEVFKPGRDGTLDFVVTKGNTSEPFALKAHAEHGRHEYTIGAAQAGLPGTGKPVVMVDP